MSKTADLQRQIQSAEKEILELNIFRSRLEKRKTLLKKDKAGIENVKNQMVVYDLSLSSGWVGCL